MSLLVGTVTRAVFGTPSVLPAFNLRLAATFLHYVRGFTKLATPILYGLEFKDLQSGQLLEFDKKNVSFPRVALKGL